MITIGVIMVLVLIVLPIGLGKLSGKSPMEVFFGSRVKNTAFGKQETEEDKKRQEEAKIQKKASGSKNDLLDTISAVLSYARRNQFVAIVPGTIAAGGQVASLAAILVTRSQIIGINCFGYGGTITADTGENDWTQNVDGRKKMIPSPSVKNAAQGAVLKAAMEEAGLTGIPMEILGVFTSPYAELRRGTRENCFTKKDMLEHLREDKYMRDLGVDPKKTAKSLDPFVKRAKEGAGKK